MSRTRVAYVPWWRPIRLVMRNGNGFDFIGWAWREKVYMVNNMHHGWIAFVEDQTPANLSCCKECGRPTIRAIAQATQEKA